jgi:ribose transport system permease protein
VVFSVARPEVYPTLDTVRLVLSGQVAIGLLAFAVLVPLAAGVFDLSVGAMMAFSMIVFTYLLQHTELGWVIVALIAVLACAAFGLLNGFLVVRLKVDSFIATLGMSQVLAALMLFISQNRQISGVFSDSFLDFTRGRFLGITHDVYYLVLIAVVVWFVLEHTPIGRYLYAIGSNADAARLAGVRVDRTIWGSLVASSVLAAIAGIVYASQVGVFSTTFGAPLLFPAFAAVFFGATQIKRRANVWGTLIALYALAFGVQGLQLVFFDGGYWITPLFNGVALVIAVAFASYRRVGKRRRRGGGQPRRPKPEPDAPPAVSTTTDVG